MREEFLEQASNAIFAKLPFFQLLENDTKVVVSEGLSVAVFSPGEYITSRKLGLTKLYILR